MNSRLCLLLLLQASTLVIEGAQPTAIPSDVVLKPTFLTGEDSLTAGTGFVAIIQDQPVFLTAHHLFGPAAGLDRDLSPKEAKAYAVALAASSMDHPSSVLVSSEMVLIESAKAFDAHGAGYDVAGFRLRGYAGPALKVNPTLPAKGDIVYLYARLRGTNDLRLLTADVTRVTKTELEYRFREKGFVLNGTSGAPVLNAQGEVVGLNVSGGEHQDNVYGFANPAASFVPLVTKALEN